MAAWISASLLVLVAAAGSSQAHPPPFFATVTDVTLANSLVIRTPEGTTRQLSLAFLAIPVPPQPYGDQAHALLRSELVDRRVSVRPVGQLHDDYLTALVYLGTSNVNLALVEQGHAWVDYAQLTHPQWNVMQHRAMTQSLGLFAGEDPVHPRLWQQELQQAETLMAGAQQMLKDPVFPELFTRTYIGHRHAEVFVPIACVAVWASWPANARVPITSLAGAQFRGFRAVGCPAAAGP